MLLSTAEVIDSQNPDRIIMLVDGLTKKEAFYVANQAVAEARKKMPKMSGDSAKRLEPIYDEGVFGIYFPDCVAVGTRVLRADWTWVPVETLSVGDALIGFDESVDKQARGRGRGRRYKTSYVTAMGIEARECVRVTFDDGSSVVSTEDHPWLAKRYPIGKPREWINAKDLKPGHSLGVYFDTWTTDDTHDGGWLSGIFDGEGHLVYSESRRYAADALAGTLGVTQNEGPVLDRMRETMQSRGFPYAERVRKIRGGKCRTLEVTGGFASQVNLLGTLRPTRLLPKIRHEGRSMEALRERTVVSVDPIGLHDVAIMSTSEETYIAEGMGSHNTYVWFQDHGIRAFTMNSLQGKTIPMWIDDPTGQERAKNPKAKTRTTESGKQQILIFRKVAMKGTRVRKWVLDKKTGKRVLVDKPGSYPGAPGRINRRQLGGSTDASGKSNGGQIAAGNSGVKWRHPGLAPRLFLNNALTLAAQWNGILPIRVYVTDANWKGRVSA